MKKGKNLSVNTVKLNDFLRDYKAYCANEEAIAIDYGNAQRDILNGFLFRDLTISGINYAKRIRENSRKRLLALKLSTVKQEEITFNEE